MTKPQLKGPTSLLVLKVHLLGKQKHACSCPRLHPTDSSVSGLQRATAKVQSKRPACSSESMPIYLINIMLCALTGICTSRAAPLQICFFPVSTLEDILHAVPQLLHFCKATLDSRGRYHSNVKALRLVSKSCSKICLHAVTGCCVQPTCKPAGTGQPEQIATLLSQSLLQRFRVDIELSPGVDRLDLASVSESADIARSFEGRRKEVQNLRLHVEHACTLSFHSANFKN